MLFSACRSNELKTFVTEKPQVIDSAYFKIIESKYQVDVQEPGKVLGGLTPRLPLAEVRSFGFSEQCLWQSQGMLPYCFSLVAQIGDTLSLVDTQEKFKQVFAPIDNEQEALSYVAFLTRTFPKYDIEKKSRYRVFVSHFPSSYAKRTAGGYEVLLHDKKVYGCGPHPYFYKIYNVTDAGLITLVQTVKMFEDPEEDGICVD